MAVWVVAADATRARIFEAHQRTGALTEQTDLVHPASRLHEGDLVSDRPGQGRGRAEAGGVAHTVGHEHDATTQERQRFARQVAAVLDDARLAERFERLYLLAGPTFLGMLREQLDQATRDRVVREINVSVAGEDIASIRARLPPVL